MVVFIGERRIGYMFADFIRKILGKEVDINSVVADLQNDRVDEYIDYCNSLSYLNVKRSEIDIMNNAFSIYKESAL